MAPQAAAELTGSMSLSLPRSVERGWPVNCSAFLSDSGPSCTARARENKEAKEQERARSRLRNRVENDLEREIIIWMLEPVSRKVLLTSTGGGHELDENSTWKDALAHEWASRHPCSRGLQGRVVANIGVQDERILNTREKRYATKVYCKRQEASTRAERIDQCLTLVENAGRLKLRSASGLGD